jgi:hypothetical protein
MARAQKAIAKFLATATPDDARAFAKAGKTSVPYLRHVAAGRRGVSAEQAQRLAHAAKKVGGAAAFITQRALCEACAMCPLIDLT